VQNLFSSAAAFAQREKPASDGNDELACKSGQPPTRETQNSAALVTRLKTKVGRASGRFLQVLGAKEKEAKESASDVIDRNYNTWQGFTRTYPMQSAFTESFMHSTEVLLDETLQNYQSSRTQREELVLALPQVSKRSWSARDSISSESNQDPVHRNRLMTLPPEGLYHTVR
jgi:hypothetical protein